MRKIERLKQEAKDACEWRGHNMRRWKLSDYWRKPYSKCETCGASVYVNDRPPANGIDICGTAVAMNCPVDPKWL